MAASYDEKIDKIAKQLLEAPVSVTASVRDHAIKAEFNGLIPSRAAEDVDQRIRELLVSAQAFIDSVSRGWELPFRSPESMWFALFWPGS